MKKIALISALVTAGVSIVSAASTHTLLTTKSGLLNELSNLPGRPLASTGRMATSPNGSYYSFVGLVSATTARVWVAGDTIGYNNQKVALAGDAAPFAPGFTLQSFRSGALGLDDAGNLYVSLDTNEATTVDDYIVRKEMTNANPLTFAAKEGDLFSGGNYLASASPSPYNGTVAFANGPGLTSTSQAIVKNGASTWVKGGSFASYIGPTDPITNHTADNYRLAQDGSVEVGTATIGANTANDQVVFVNGNVMAREGFNLPDFLPALTVSSLIGGLSHSAAAAGGWYCYRGTEAVTNNEFAVIGNINTGFKKLIRQTDPIATGETETWSGAVASGGLAISGIGVNKWGEAVITGYSSRANGLQDFVIIYDNGYYSQVLVREGDQIDANNNNVLDDDANIQSVLNDNVSISDSNEIFVSATCVNSGGTGGFGAAIQIFYPIIADVDGDGEVGSTDFDLVVAQFGTAGTADIDHDGEVGSTDFDIVVAQFGRS
ncbi:MAG: hypothetical protein J0L72_05935 [Armatimonadetes bacterium]|nr:hypothetical protein [Armatimonadota bacterium]